MTLGLAIPQICAGRLADDIETLSRITDPERPWTRRSFSARFLEGRAWLRRAFEAEGLACRIDAAGNLIGRLEGGETPGRVLMTGSHSDTVPDGGRFDGVAGILGGLAAVRAMRKVGYRRKHSIEVVDFLAEEPSEWGLSCIGSRGMSGALGEKELALNGPGGETLADAIDRIGGDVTRLAQARRTDIKSFVELHIEQGPVLERESCAIGIVTGIAGILRIRVVFSGMAAHAGTAPMEMRADAGLALARFSLAMRDEALRLAQSGKGHFVATIGVTELLPGGANVVSGEANAILDIRAAAPEVLDLAKKRFAHLAREAAIAEDCKVAAFAELSRSQPTPCDPILRARIETAARQRQLSARMLTSGAGHDTAFLSRIAPAAMIFAPSRDGRSHCPEEWSEPDQIAAGAACLLDTLLLCDVA